MDKSTLDTMLHRAAIDGDAEGVRAKLAMGASLYAHHPDGVTPFMRAAANGHLECLEILWEAGKKASMFGVVGRLDAQGRPALIHAAQAGHANCVAFLLAKGAAVDQVGNNGYTPIMAAASTGSLECVHTLVEGGASLTSPKQNNDLIVGMTPAMCAYHFQHPETLQALLNYGSPAPEFSFALDNLAIPMASEKMATCFQIVVDALKLDADEVRQALAERRGGAIAMAQAMLEARIFGEVFQPAHKILQGVHV